METWGGREEDEPLNFEVIKPAVIIPVEVEFLPSLGC